jgi:hypothetical protein
LQRKDLPKTLLSNKILEVFFNGSNLGIQLFLIKKLGEGEWIIEL